jgi:hypothetical protein
VQGSAGSEEGRGENNMAPNTDFEMEESNDIKIEDIKLEATSETEEIDIDYDIMLNKYEQATESVSTEVHIGDVGRCYYEIEANDFCQQSKHTGWHIKRSEGKMQIQLKFRGLQVQGHMLIRAVLVRKSETYRAFGIDQVCNKHGRGIMDRKQVLQPASGFEHKAYYGEDGPRHSVCFMVGEPNQANNTLYQTIGLKYMCNDSCNTTSVNTKFRQTHRARDLWLVLTLESVRHKITLARRKISIWPKAEITKRDLVKKERRLPQGGAAQSIKKKELTARKRAAGQNRDTAEAGTAGQPPPNQTSRDLMEDGIQLAITSAQKLAIGNAEFMEIITKRLKDSSHEVTTPQM